MADISDVENAVAAFISGTLYPSGISEPSLTGATCRVYRGWPANSTLNNDLSAGIVNVTVVSDNEPGRTTTRYLPKPITRTTTPGVAVSTAGNRLTIAGNPASGDVVGILVDGAAYAYRVQAGDTVDLVAANLGLQVQAGRPATVRGASVTVPGSRRLLARCTADGQTTTEIRRQEKNVSVICWCATPQSRDTTSSALDRALSQVAFLPLPDSTFARVQYVNSKSHDQAQNALLYRRDLVYCAEYPTIDVSASPSMLFGSLGLNDVHTIG